MAGTCKDISTPNTQWTFCPNEPADYLFIVLFALVMTAHLVQAIYHRKGFSWVITMSALWQTVAYIFRIISIQNPVPMSYYVAWFVLLFVAPLWTNAFVYMVLGRMIWNFTNTSRILGVSAWRFGTLFITLDIVAFIVQLYGASTAASANNNAQQALNGIHIYMGGIGVQQIFIFIFLAFAIRFHLTILREGSLDRSQMRRARMLLYTIYASLLMITIRIIFRLIEYSKGLHSTIPNHEAFQYCLDSLPMWFALLFWNICHPGRLMPGKESDIPSKKQRKARMLDQRMTEEMNERV